MGVHPGTRNLTPPPEAASALAWIAAASVPVTALEEAATIRLALDACARTIAGKPAAATTQRRKRAVFHNAASHAVELRLLDSNPVDRIRWKAPPSPRPSTAAWSPTLPRSAFGCRQPMPPGGIRG